jgi:hypothetical protein
MNNLPSGGRLQSGINKRIVPKTPQPMHHLLRGVVMATYVTDDPNHPFAQSGPSAVYCDVLCYTSLTGGRYWLITGVLVSQELGCGIHHGRLFKPRATKGSIDGVPIAENIALDPATLDGDHVVLGFFEGQRSQPVILRALPHPSLDASNSAGLPAGQRLHLKLIDGDPSFFKHHGSFYGVGQSGDFVCDTSLANNGTTLPGGAEPPQSATLGGSVRFTLPPTTTRTTSFVTGTAPNAVLSARETLSETGVLIGTGTHDPNWQLSSQNGNTLQALHSGAAATLTVGDGQYHVALAEALKAFWESTVYPFLASHQHVTGVGISSVPTTPAPHYDAAITSANVAVPAKGGV